MSMNWGSWNDPGSNLGGISQEMEESFKWHAKLTEECKTDEDVKLLILDRMEEKGFDREVIDKAYSEPHRFYHNWNHIIYMYKLATLYNLCSNVMCEAIVYHDIVYDPKKDDNEFQSAELHRKHSNSRWKSAVYGAILSTKNHQPQKENWISKYLIKLDLTIFRDTEEKRLEYERSIRKEYDFVPIEVYRKERTKILQELKPSQIKLMEIVLSEN